MSDTDSTPPLPSELPPPPCAGETDLPPLPAEDELPPLPDGEELPPLPPPPTQKPLNKSALMLWLLAAAAGIAALQFQGSAEQARQESTQVAARVSAEQQRMKDGADAVATKEKKLEAVAMEDERLATLTKEVEELNTSVTTAVRRYNAETSEMRQRILELEAQKRQLASQAQRRLRKTEKVVTTVQPPTPLPSAEVGTGVEATVKALVEQYISNRTNGDGYRLSNQFAEIVQYKYSDFRKVPRSTVMDDIRSGWDKWPTRSYRLIRAGYRDSIVEVVFRYQFRTSSGKRVSGYSKETWTLDENNRIATWTETTSRQTPPPITRGLTIIEF